MTTQLTRARNTLRLSTLLWMREDRITEVFRLLNDHPEIHEVAFFTTFTHSPLKLAEICEVASKLEKVMPRFREHGVSAGINHLVTLGHLDENLDNSLDEPWQRLVDVSGKVAQGSFCISDSRMRDYVIKLYHALSAARPEFIWVDDDVRMEWHPPVTHSCFCELCLSKFSRQNGREWSRETLAAAFNEGSLQERLALRKDWLIHNREYMLDVLGTIRNAVDEIDPSIELGYMSSSLHYSGADFENWALALCGEKSLQERPVKWRPGGGFYIDDTPISLLGKMNDVGAQIARLPQELCDIQYEHENFPYQRISKSSTIFVAEIAAAIGAGCTGVALNVMGLSEGSIAEYDVYYDTMQQCTAFFDKAVATFGRSGCEGLGLSFVPDTYAAVSPGKEWPKVVVPNVNDLSQIGLPMAYNTSGSRVTILVGDVTLQWSREELLKILAGGVLMDGVALQHLSALGLNEHVGFAIQGGKEHDTIERFFDDPLNGVYTGWTRDVRPSFWNETAHLLAPLTADSRTLSEIIDFKSRIAGIGSGVYENTLGGRVAVMGYFPWRMVNSLAKTAQLKSLCRWLSRDTIPAYIASYSRAALWCRRDASGRTALMVMNVSLDVQALTLRVLATECAPQMCLTDMNGVEKVLTATDDDEKYRTFTIEPLGVWQAALLTHVV